MVPAFTISRDLIDPSELEQCLLLLEVGENHFRYVFFNREKGAVHCLRQYVRDKGERNNETEWIDELIASDEWLQQKAKEAVIVYNYTDSTLLPESVFQMELNRPVTELLYGDAPKGLFLSEKIQGWPMYNVYRIPRKVHSMLQQKFSAGRYWHHYSLLLHSMQEQQQEGDQIRLLLYNEQFCLMLWRDKQLQLLQAYAYQAPEDLSYYLLSVCKQWQMDSAGVKVRLAGLVDVDSALYEEIGKYFLHIEVDSLPGFLEKEAGLDQYPEHYFSPLFEMIACV